MQTMLDHGGHAWKGRGGGEGEREGGGREKVEGGEEGERCLSCRTLVFKKR